MKLLDRYIFDELLRLTLLATGVIVTVLAFGAAIKPVANDRLLSAAQALKYIVLATIPMLQFALPFSAGFAGTLCLHRMTSDNEIAAAAMGGVSYRRLLVPVAGLGVALTIVMLLLTQWVIPRFWTVLERAVAQDVTRVFQSTIDRGESYRFGHRMIYADKLVPEPVPEGSEIDTRLTLLHVAAAYLDDAGQIDKDVTASKAVVDIYRRPGTTFIRLTMVDAVAYDPDAGVLAHARRLDSRTIVIPTSRRDDGKFKTGGELLEVRRNPDSFGRIMHRKTLLAEALRDEAMWRELRGRLQDRGAVELTPRRASSDEPWTYRVHADRLAAGRFANAGGRPVEIEQLEAGRVRRRFFAGEAGLESRTRGPGEPVFFDLFLTDCRVVDTADPGLENRRERLPLEDLAIVGIQTEPLVDLPSPTLIARAAALKDASSVVTERAASLAEKIVTLRHEMTGRLHQRYALSITAMLLLVLGATLAMWLRECLPLTVYLWAFVPAIANLILISGGDHMVREGAVAGGLAVLWLGNVALAGLLLFGYWRLSRH